MITPNAFSHVGLRAADVHDTVAFLEERLDATLRDRGDIARDDWEQDVRYAALDLAGTTVFVVHPTPYEAAGLVEPLEPGIAHYGIEVDDVETALDDWRESGGVLMEPFDLGDTRYAFCHGPDLTRIELVETPDGR
ncbi:VOC family protein [Halarchaeum salinum]|uniref:VOC domain-containing protein n=1 Tax=Halarchaeum salinum TaxID=489912 RepID=A0AAV3S7M1_9EURY